MTAAGQWDNALDEISLQMTRATFDTWLASSHVIMETEGEITVAVQHPQAVEWLQDRMLPVLMPTISRHLPGVKVRFIPEGPAPTRPAADEVLEQPIMEAVHEERVQIGGPSGTLVWTDFYIKLKLAFRRKALRELKGAPLSVFLCLALHMDKDGVAYPGIETIMNETGYTGRATVCSALDTLVDLGLCTKRSSYRGNDEYIVNGYAWFGKQAAPALWEEHK